MLTQPVIQLKITSLSTIGRLPRCVTLLRIYRLLLSGNGEHTSMTHLVSHKRHIDKVVLYSENH
jgi:hypothetical protein